MKVLLTGGGTGGHINPALAIASIIKSRDPSAEFLFAGTPFGMESDLIPKAGYDFAEINVRGFQRKISAKNIKRNVQALLCLATANTRAKEIIDGFKPDIVIGTGGYVSEPVVAKAAKMKIPTAIHEANAFPGMTTKLLAKNVGKVMLTVEEAKEHLPNCNWTVTGLPVREGIAKKTREQARKELGLDDNMCILSFGGSLGAGKINETMIDVIDWNIKNSLDINIIHGYGGNGKNTFPQAMSEIGITDRIRATEYISNMETCIAAADLVICRSGASTLAELTAAGRASILIPSPIVAGNHQFHNARVVEKAGGAFLIEQKDVTSEKIIDIVQMLFQQPNKIHTMEEKAAALAISDIPDRIFNVITSLLK